MKSKLILMLHQTRDIVTHQHAFNHNGHICLQMCDLLRIHTHETQVCNQYGFRWFPVCHMIVWYVLNSLCTRVLPGPGSIHHIFSFSFVSVFISCQLKSNWSISTFPCRSPFHMFLNSLVFQVEKSPLIRSDYFNRIRRLRIGNGIFRNIFFALWIPMIKHYSNGNIYPWSSALHCVKSSSILIHESNVTSDEGWARSMYQVDVNVYRNYAMEWFWVRSFQKCEIKDDEAYHEWLWCCRRITFKTALLDADHQIFSRGVLFQ